MMKDVMLSFDACRRTELVWSIDWVESVDWSRKLQRKRYSWCRGLSLSSLTRCESLHFIWMDRA